MYNKLFTKILDSSIWLESDAVRLVWITLLAAMDENSYAHFSAIGNLALRARVSIEDAEQAVEKFINPDPDSGDPEYSGRRIERVPGGFLILNGQKHRSQVTKAVAQEMGRERIRRWRARKKEERNAELQNGNGRVTQSEAEAEADTERANTLSPSGDGLTAEQASAGQELRSGTTRKRARQPKHAMPEDFGISERVKSWAIEKGHTRLADHLEAFKAKCKANGYAYADWDSAFMEAIRGDWAKLGNPRLSTASNGGNSPAASRPL